MSEPVGAVEGAAPVEAADVLRARTDAAIRELCAEQSADFRAHAALNLLNGSADQSLPLASRDGLAGSDEARRAPNRVRPSDVIIVGARMTADVLDLVRDVKDGFAEAVRTEAVAEERQRIAAELELGWPYISTLAAALLIVRAAGSVPVATPEPTEAERWDAFHQGGADWRHDLELGCSPTCPCSNPRPGPVAIPPEPDGQCAHCTVIADDVCPCREPATAEALTSFGYWKPVCEEHAKRYRDLRPRTTETATQPSVGTGTPPVEPHRLLAALIEQCHVRLSLTAEVARLRAAIGPGASAVAEISTMISRSYPPNLDPEAHMWRRHQKVANEAGEVLDAIEGAIGENPRKGVVKTWADVDKELLDTAVAALGAYEHNHGNDASSVRAMLAHAVTVRASLAAALRDGA